jgi:hypothetical protein
MAAALITTSPGLTEAGFFASSTLACKEKVMKMPSLLAK